MTEHKDDMRQAVVLLRDAIGIQAEQLRLLRESMERLERYARSEQEAKRARYDQQILFRMIKARQK